MAACRKQRTVDELYNATEVIRKPKITSVLKGSNRMQGPVEETEQDIEKNMLPSQSEKRLGKRSMRRKGHTRVESGTCNVCSAPCSSCMHLKLACMGSKIDEISDENCHVTATSQNSVNENDTAPSRNRACDSLQHTGSEASNLLSVNSSHDSLSENAESKANIRCSDIADASLESEMLPKSPCGGNAAEDQLSAKPLCMLDEKTSSNVCPKVVEGHDDNTSCVRRVNDASKPLSCSSVLVYSLGPEGSGKTLISPKPELLETPSNDVDAGSSSPKVRNRCLSSSTNSTHMEEDIKLDASKVSIQVYPKIEVEVKQDIGDQHDEKLLCSSQAEQEEKSNESVGLPEMQDHPLQSVSEDESDESEILEHDVKVCDICGDAGREDLLAICSKCSDGAEHTYCMREMLQKVPEGYWLCEECKVAEETENQKQGSDAEGKKIHKENRQNFLKRPAENLEVASAAKRQALEKGFVSPKSSSPTRTAALSRDSSFKGLDKAKVKLGHQTSFANHSSIDIPEPARPSIGPRLQTPKGTLMKSNSFNTFNSKPKVKHVDEVSQKQKGSRDLDMKEGTARMISKSMSFRSANAARSNTSETKAKMLSPKFSQAQDVKGLKQVKERNAFENKSLSKLDRPIGSSVTTSSSASVPKVNQKLTPRGEGVIVSFAGNNREPKASQSDGKTGSLLRSSSSLARKGVEIPSNSVRSLLANGASNTPFEQKSSQVSPKEEPSSSSSWTAERPVNNVDESLHDGLSRSRESSSQSEKTRDSSANRSRPGISTGQKNLTCHKCKEIGHIAEFCSGVGPRVSGTEAPASRSVREDIGKASKLKAAIEAAMLKKPGIFRKKKGSDQSDGLSSSNVDATSEIASQDQSHDLFIVSNRTKNMTSDEGRDEGQANLVSCSSETSKHINSNNVKQHNIHSTDSAISFKVGDSDSAVSSFGKADRALTVNPLLSKMLTIPEHEYIWQGTLEVRRDGKLLDLYGGIQGHLSTCASPKVLEVVNQFPHKITMDEVPRISTWPRYFQDNGVKEDNIALYFFAKDLESYEKSYRNLLDNMIKRDSALRVSFDSVEFLIFPSTQLPENSQRWNMLFFLWGVFWGRRSAFPDLIKRSVFPNSNVLPLDINTPGKPYTTLNGEHDSKVPGSQTDSEKQNDRLNSKSFSKNATNSAFLFSDIKCAGPSQEVATLPECGLDAEEHKLSTMAAGTNGGSNDGEETQKHVDTSAREDLSSAKIFQTGKQDGARDIIDEEKKVDRMDIDRDESKVERNLNEDPPSMDAEASSGSDVTIKGPDYWQPNSRKRSSLDLSEKPPQTFNSTTQKLPWISVNDAIVDRESNSKRPRTVFHEHYGGSSMKDGTLGDRFASRRCDLGPSSTVEGKSCEKPADEKVIHEDLGTTERYFFPVESRHVKEIQMGGNSMPWKEYSSNDENQFPDGVPNLELALGAETKPPNKGIVPFFVGMVEKNNTQNKTSDKVADKEEEDGASLSLSLSFPFPDKEQTVKPVSKTEQLLPERRHVNSPLLLFRGFSDK